MLFQENLQKLENRVSAMGLRCARLAALAHSAQSETARADFVARYELTKALRKRFETRLDTYRKLEKIRF